MRTETGGPPETVGCQRSRFNERSCVKEIKWSVTVQGAWHLLLASLWARAHMLAHTIIKHNSKKGHFFPSCSSFVREWGALGIRRPEARGTKSNCPWKTHVSGLKGFLRIHCFQKQGADSAVATLLGLPGGMGALTAHLPKKLSLNNIHRHQEVVNSTLIRWVIASLKNTRSRDVPLMISLNCLW